ncbi:hypothetical protein RRG08_028339 [Elysia crispata]|uniref:Uncharacterized protein n=1 Tax=Elysia crispata TaxID=231223 RepID=A0AAE1AWE7_9GAST|nr:hypothetical protein RRG08_028339 [Elysia crispata]
MEIRRGGLVTLMPQWCDDVSIQNSTLWPITIPPLLQWAPTRLRYLPCCQLTVLLSAEGCAKHCGTIDEVTGRNSFGQRSLWKSRNRTCSGVDRPCLERGAWTSVGFARTGLDNKGWTPRGGRGQ